MKHLKKYDYYDKPLSGDIRRSLQFFLEQSLEEHDIDIFLSHKEQIPHFPSDLLSSGNRVIKKTVCDKLLDTIKILDNDNLEQISQKYKGKISKLLSNTISKWKLDMLAEQRKNILDYFAHYMISGTTSTGPTSFSSFDLQEFTLNEVPVGMKIYIYYKHTYNSDRPKKLLADMPNKYDNKLVYCYNLGFKTTVL